MKNLIIMRVLLITFFFLLSTNTHAITVEDKLTKSFKNKIYELVKIQYYKDRLSNSSNNNYFSYKGDKSLAACLNWEILSKNFQNYEKKYMKPIVWGSSFSENFSKNEAINTCKRRSRNKNNCNCHIVDYKNSNNIIIPEFILAELGSLNKNSQLSNNSKEKERLVKLKKLYDDNLITIDEYNSKKNEILDIVNPKNNSKKMNKVISKDSTGPKINIASFFEADENLVAMIQGSVSDESKIEYVTVANDQVFLKDGKFNHQLFVKAQGQKVLITAMDKYGNKSNISVQLKRAKNIIKTKNFEYLNPTLIKAKVKPSAVALIIGIEDYENTFAAPFAKNDALAFNDFVHFSLGVPKQNIKLLMNDDAGRTNTLTTIAKWLPRIVKEDKSDVYVFFSGHGLASEDGEDLYLLPSDGDPELLEDSTLLRNSLFKKIAKLNPKSVTVFLDTCYSGATRTNEFLVAAKPIFIVAEEQDIPPKFTVFSASAGRETAKVLKEAEHGLFSYYMMKGLEGEADANSDNQITNGELIAFINKYVSRQANQTPQLNGNPNNILVQW